MPNVAEGLGYVGGCIGHRGIYIGIDVEGAVWRWGT